MYLCFSHTYDKGFLRFVSHLDSVVEYSLAPQKDRYLGPLGNVALLYYIGGKVTGSESDGFTF